MTLPYAKAVECEYCKIEKRGGYKADDTEEFREHIGHENRFAPPQAVE